MIDTVLITLPIHRIRIRNPEYFEPNAKWLWEAPFIPFSNHIAKCVQNPTKEDLRMKIYKPRLTFIKSVNNGNMNINLRIELSLPKLLFWNNFDELKDDDFSKILGKLKNKLENMGIITEEKYIAEGQVSTIHYSKNIVFTDFTSVSSIINTVSKINASKIFDLGQTDYSNWWELHLMNMTK